MQRFVPAESGDALPGIVQHLAPGHRMHTEQIQQAAGKTDSAGEPHLRRIDALPGGKQGRGHAGHAGTDDHQFAGGIFVVDGHGVTDQCCGTA